jgi:hypothetical protein
MRHGADGFIFFPREGVLWILIALKNPSPLTEFEPANLGSNGKQGDRYTTEDKWHKYTYMCYERQ